MVAWVELPIYELRDILEIEPGVDLECLRYLVKVKLPLSTSFPSVWGHMDRQDLARVLFPDA